MSSSAVKICSNALLLLGDNPISSFDEANNRTRLVANLWEQKRDAVLRMHPWNCATRRETLSPEEDAPEFGWAYKFALPGDWMRTLSIGLDDENQDDFVIEGRMILMDRNVCRLRYIWRNEDVSTWDALLIDAMSQVMIATLAYAVTKSTTKQANEQEIVKQVLKQARATDGQEQTAETLGDFPLLANRMS